MFLLFECFLKRVLHEFFKQLRFIIFPESKLFFELKKQKRQQHKFKLKQSQWKQQLSLIKHLFFFSLSVFNVFKQFLFLS